MLEGTSFRQAVRQTRREARQRRAPIAAVVRNPHDPTVRSVVLEDSAALAGILIAASGVGLHQLTGSSTWDGIASLTIGALLIVAAALLARTCQGLLIGMQADAGLMRRIEQRIEEQDEVDDVVDLERACVRIDELLRADFPTPWTRSSSRWRRSRIREFRPGCARYGHELADG